MHYRVEKKNKSPPKINGSHPSRAYKVGALENHVLNGGTWGPL